MTEKQASALKVGNTVETYSLPPGEHHTGTVIEVGYCGVKIEWDDGQIGITHPADMAKINITSAASVRI